MVFPMCPATVAGTFGSDRHDFYNFAFVDILGDLKTVIGKARQINPALRFLFTALPVPLAATATILRAVARRSLTSTPQSITFAPTSSWRPRPFVEACLNRT